MKSSMAAKEGTHRSGTWIVGTGYMRLDQMRIYIGKGITVAK
jgi:hypothetical protein